MPGDRHTRKTLAEAAAYWAALVLVPDLVSRGWGGLRPEYLLSAPSSLLGLLFALVFLAWLRQAAAWLAWPALLFTAVLFPVAVVGTLQYRRILAVDVPPSAVDLVLRSPRYSLGIAVEGTAWWHWVAAALGIAAVLAALVRATRKPLLPGRLRGLVLVPALGLPLSIAAHVNLGSPLPPDTQGFVAVLGGGLLRVFNRQKLPKQPERIVPPAGAAQTPDVVVLVHESLGSYQWRPWSKDPARSPVLERFLEEHADHALHFPTALSSAGATDVSVPSILTGLGPDAANADYAKAPVLWQEARVLGYLSGLVSAQRFEEANFPSFFLERDAPDFVRKARDFPDARRTVDSGIDDAVAVDGALGFVDTVPAGKPYVLVVQFNGTHGPCFLPSDAEHEKWAPAGEELRKRCAEAADVVAEQTVRLMRGLEARGRLDRTLVLGTSDHASETIRTDRPPRVESYYEHSIRVPLFLVLPRTMLGGHPEWMEAARANAAGRASNVDIYPTVLDVWGRWPVTSERPALAGSSLVRPVPADRTLVVSNTNEIRSWSRDGFALYRGPWKWLADDREGFRAFRPAEDPDEDHDLWRAMPAAERARFEEEARRRPPLRKILERLERRQALRR